MFELRRTILAIKKQRFRGVCLFLENLDIFLTPWELFFWLMTIFYTPVFLATNLSENGISKSSCWPTARRMIRNLRSNITPTTEIAKTGHLHVFHIKVFHLTNVFHDFDVWTQRGYGHLQKSGVLSILLLIVMCLFLIIVFVLVFQCCTFASWQTC